MMRKGNSLGKRIFSGILSLMMILTYSSMDVFAAGGTDGLAKITKDVAPLMTGFELTGEGVTVDEDGVYHVKANTAYNLKLAFEENKDLEMDMSDYIQFSMPDGSTAGDEKGQINIGVRDSLYSHDIDHNYVVDNDKLKITWNKDSKYFADLARAHDVNFNVNLSATFDGSKDEVKFGTENSVVVKVDNTGKVTVNKTVTGLKSGVTMTDAQKAAMTFELRDSTGAAIRTFTYADMEKNSISFDKIKPGQYSVVETGHPNFTNHSFDEADSVVVANGTLENGGVLTLSLKNDYEYDKGDLVLNKSIDCTNWDGSKTFPESMKDKIRFTITGPYDYSKTVSYADEGFKNGKYELKGLDVGEYTITETNEVTGYTWTYKVNNAAAEKAEATAQVTKGGTAEVSFENTYVEKTADLKIVKTVSGGPAVPAGTQFKVTYPGGHVETFTYSQMPNGEKLFRNVPLGTYKVEEISGTGAVANYKLTVSGTGDVKVEKADEEKTATIKNTYTPLGSLKVAKTITGLADDLNPNQEAQRNGITFTVYNSANKSVGTMTYADILSGKDTISNLPVGTYTIKETKEGITGYSVDTVPGEKAVSVEVKVGETATGSFTNKYTKDEYKISVHKVFADGSAYDVDNLPDAVLDNTTFTIKKGTEVVVPSCTLRNLAATLNSVELDGPGPYTVTETNPASSKIPGVSVSTWVSVNDGSFASGKSKEVTIENHKPTTVTFKNKYTLQGKIIGDKTVLGLNDYDEADIRSKVRFTVYQYDSATNTFKEYKKNITIADLEKGFAVPVGKYYLQETGILGVDGFNGPKVSTKVECKNGTDVTTTESDISETKVFEVKQSGTATVHYTNAYVTGDGSGTVKLIKYVKGLEAIDGPDAVTLTRDINVQNTKGVLLYDGICFKLEQQMADEKWYEVGTYSLDTLCSGMMQIREGHYRLTEMNADVENYGLHVDYLIKSVGTEPASQTGYQVEFDVAKEQTLDVEVHNVYAKLGNLEIEKQITGDLVDVYKTYLGESSRKSIVFTVEGPFGFKDTFTFNDIWSSADKNHAVKKYVNIPVGEYTITETAKNLTSYKLTATTCDDADGKVTVPVGGTAKIKYTNQYDHKLGKLVIKKNIEGDLTAAELTDEQKAAMKYTVTGPSYGFTTKTFSYADMTGGVYELNNVPTGSYTVSEDIDGVLTNNYIVNVTNKNKTVSVDEGKTVTVTITNKFTKTGTLVLKKNFDGAQISDELKASLKFKYWKLDESGAKIGDGTTVSYSDFSNGSYTVQNLVPGRYAVEELDNTTGYTRSTTVQVNEGTAVSGTAANTDIEFGKTSTVTFNNTYGEISSLKITKAIAGALTADKLTADQKNAISFEVTGPNNFRESFTYAEMASGKTFKGLTPGEYTVTETISDPDEKLFGDYTCATTYKIGSATAVNGKQAEVQVKHGANTVAFTNKYTKIDPLKVVKSSSKTYVGTVATEDAAKYPVWEFKLNITNMSPLTTREGTTTFTDNFDAAHAGWFRLATDEEVQKALGDTSAKSYSIKSLVTGKAAPSAVFTEDNKIVVSDITADTADKCEFTYYLIIKDRAALSALNAANKESTTDGVSHKFNNVVTYHPMPYKTDTVTTNADYEYSFRAVLKGLLNVDEYGNLYDEVDGKKVIVNYADYSVVLNEDGATIGDEPTITAVDTFSENQTILVSSITTDPDEKAGVSYKLDNEKHTLTFTIPNGTPVTVSYRATIAKSDKANVTLTNKLDLSGFETVIEQNANRSIGGEGEGVVYSINVVKTDSTNQNKKLDGVVFGLYDGETDELLETYTTKNGGQFEVRYWGDDGSLKPDHNYYLKEQSTIAGYNKKIDPIWFRVASDKKSDTLSNISILNNGGELEITNDPVVADLEVTKAINNWSKQGRFTFKLKAVDGAPMPGTGGDIAVATEANKTAKFGTIFYPVEDKDFAEGKTVTYNYLIQEIINEADMVDGIWYDTAEYPASVTISDADNDGIREVAVAYGDKESLTVTNKYEEVSVSGSKTWADAEDKYENRPESIKITLNANGKPVRTIDVSAEDNWAWSFTNLPKYIKGVEAQYSVTEEKVATYLDPVYEGYNVTNTPEYTKLSGEKTWNDNNNEFGNRPESIKVTLFANGEPFEDKSVTVTPDENGKWSWSFENLPKYINKKEVKYTVAEDAVTGYTPSVNGGNITNTPKLINIDGKKNWNDNSNEFGNRPDSITINLTGVIEGQEAPVVTAKTTATASNNWSYEFKDLPEYYNKQKVTYSVEEVAVPGYVPSYNGYNVTNTPSLVDVSGEKTWNDEEWADLEGYERPETILINLLANGTKIKDKTVKADEETGKWNYEFKGLPEYRDGKKVTYSVTEEVVGYTVDKPEEGGEYDLENTPNADLDEDVTGKLSLFVEKVDAATKYRINGAEFKVERLDEDGKPIGDSDTAKGNADYIFEDAGTYRFTEMTPPGGYETCESVFVVNVEKVFNHTERNDEGIWVKYYDLKVASITESGKPASGISFEDPSTLTSVSAEKVWEDNDDQDGLRDDAVIEFTLYDGETVASVKDAVVTVGKDVNWRYTWKDLPAYRDGKEIKYSVKETKVPDGYTSSTADANAVPDENGKAVITNTHKPGEVSVNGAKTWADDNNKYKNRPEQIVINLTGTIEGKTEPVVTKSATVTADDGWAWSFTGLPEKLEKKTVTYKVTEEPVATYKTSYSEEGYDVTNTPETVKVEGSKTWNDGEDKYGNRPKSIKITLLANDKPFEDKSVTVTPDENGKWSWSFENLPKYINKKEVKYTVAEDAVTGYTPSVNGGNITNTPKLINIEGKKNWNDNSNEFGNRPNEITINLKGVIEGQATPVVTRTAKATASGNWSYEFKDLPEYYNKQKVTYSVEEVAVPGYVPSYNGYNVTNTPSLVDVSGEKTWNDEAWTDLDGYKRPDTILINLLENGTKIKDKTVKADEETGKWNYEFKGLPEYRGGKKVEYTVTETVVGYTAEKPEEGEAYDLVNTPNANLDEEQVKPLELEIVKTDENTGNPLDGAEFEISQLSKETGEYSEPQTVAGNDVFSFKDEGTYRIVETVAPEGYELDTTEYMVVISRVYDHMEYDTVKGWIYYYYLKFDSVDGEFNADEASLTVADTPTTVDITAKKIWDDSKNKDGKRKEIEFTLYDGNVVADVENAVQTLGTKDKESCTWENLPAYRDGKEIKYSVKETKVPDKYVSSTEFRRAKVDENGNVTITNTYKGNPKTGDENNLLINLFALIGSLMAGAGLLIGRKRRDA